VAHQKTEICEILYNAFEREISQRLFGPDFQSYGAVCSYLEKHFGACNNQIHDFIANKTTKSDWSTSDFHALYIACWIYKPLEKGTYFLRLTDWEARKVRVGFEKLPTRKSSHLDGKGRSAHSGWAFLAGYEELLVQWHKMGDRTYLMLKAEGHTTGIASLYPHMKSWYHKSKTGAGLMANESLHELAVSDNSPVLERAAENYSKEYKSFLKKLGKARGIKKLQKATTSVRDMLSALTGQNWTLKTNRQVRLELERLASLILMAQVSGDADVDFLSFIDDSEKMAMQKQFQRFAKLFELENRPDAVYQRFFEEVHVNPDQISNAVEEFVEWDLPVSTIAQTQRRSEMGNFA